MLLAFGAISGTSISALPDALRVSFLGFVTYTATESDDLKLYTCTEEYISRVADNPSGQPFTGIMDKLPRFDRSIIGGDGFSGLTNGWGSVGLINVGAMDNLIESYAVDGRDVTFKAGDPTGAYSGFFEVAKVVATSLTIDGQFLTVGLQDKSFKLNVPTQPNVYLGTGGLEGGPELANKRKPLCLGRVKNITPTLLIAAELVLQAHDGAVSAISAVYDKGYALTFSADYATPTLLRAAAITDGYYATCVAYGLLRTGAAYTQLTCDVNGDASGGGYVETTGTIMRRVNVLTACLSDPAEIDTVSFANLEITQPAPVGYYLDANSTETVAETFSKLTKGTGGFCGFTRLGMLQAGVFTAPDGTPAGSYTDHEIISIDVETLPSSLDPPPWRQRIAYERNWTIINDPVAGVSVADPARAAWLGTPYKVASTTDAQGTAILDDHLLAQDPNVREAYFVLAVDALAEANRSLTLVNSNYRLYRILLKIHPFTHDICQTARVTTNRFGFDAGKLLRIPAISDITDDNTVEVRAYG